MIIVRLFLTLTLAALTIGAQNTLALGTQDAPQLKAEVYRSCTKNNTVALTFDGGPYKFGKDLVDKLNAAGAKATFFYTGNNRRCIYHQTDTVQYAFKHGHQIASETWSHISLRDLPRYEVHSEIQKINEAIERIVGVVPAFFRPPFSEYNNRVLKIAKEHGVDAVFWDFNSRDRATTGFTPQQQRQVYDELIKDRPPHVMSLQHESYEHTVYNVVPYILQRFKEKGYEIVTVADCLGLPAYQNRSVLQNPISEAHC